jgi:hypothetical protein
MTIARLLFRDANGYVLLEQQVEIKSAASYPIKFSRHGPKLTGPSQLGCWVKAIGRAHENRAGTMHWIELESQVPNASDPSQYAAAMIVARFLHQDLTSINCAWPAAYPGPGLGWSMNFMPIHAGWCIPAYLPWLKAGATLGTPTVVASIGQYGGPTSAQQRDAFLRAVFAPDTVDPPTRRSTVYLTPRSQRTEICPCGSHYSVCNMHADWLTVD